MSDQPAIVPGKPVTIWVNGEALEARLGQTIGAAMLAAGRRTVRHTRKAGKPRGLFCAMGTCFDCVVTVNGTPGMRACMTPVETGMRVSTPVRFESLERA
jgi:predicted molibdopterin-dependent oxidoreductase YjgC